MTSLMGLGAGLHSSGPVQFHAVKCPVYLYTHLQLVSKATIYAQGKLRGVVPFSGSVLGEDKAVRNSSVRKLYRGREPWPRGGDRLGGFRQFPRVHKLYRGRGAWPRGGDTRRTGGIKRFPRVHKLYRARGRGREVGTLDRLGGIRRSVR